MELSPIFFLDTIQNNHIYIKREDLIPYSFGGNKARKAQFFFKEIDSGGYDCVVTYGSSHSNHCRVIANLAASRSIPCIIISPLEDSDRTYNSYLLDIFDARIVKTPLNTVSTAIQDSLNKLRQSGGKPYFIQGGGHGNLGTEAYTQCYFEIKQFEEDNGIHFDYICVASGTGTTQAGLICGQLISGDDRKIIGISIARKNPYGGDVVIESVKSYLDKKYTDKVIEDNTIFLDDYVSNGYASHIDEVDCTIQEVIKQYGIPMDSTYVGKAFWGMKNYIKTNKISEKRILFIHTGGTPLFFDDIRRMGE